ncbi:DUF4347 domain-containing protein [Comamonas sp. UBA7528]|uniref:DUF4347 domain-containing protein n=1 Tax=Comamonas sp. UBA7528 TaxID=1946391 RepID=UPI0025C3759F|nr:DUF4347 domain-containing protein [Comamonas sp. UBA7528]
MTAHNRPFWRRLAQAAAASKTSASAVQNTAPAGAGSAMRPLALEQRFMFDGAGAADAAHAVADGATGSDAGADTASALRHALMAEAAPATSQRQEVVFVDSQVPNLAELLAGLSSSAEVVILDAGKDGLQQMADYLQGRNGLDAIHLLSHGADGTVQMGNVWLSSANLGEHSAALQGIGAALKADGDLMLYGCDVGQGDKGQAFLDQLAVITGADVAASADDTGAAALGGNWSLERSSGQIETSAQVVAGYDGVLASSWTTGSVPLGTSIGNAGRTVVGDFDGDGDTDILYQTGGNGTAFAYARSNGDGTFTNLSFASSPFAGLSLPDITGTNYFVGDFDGDGDVDILVGVNGSSGQYFRNDGGTLSSQSSANFPAPTVGSRMVVADFDGDGDSDILYQTGTNGSAWAYARSNGDGTFTNLSFGSSPFAGLTLPDHGGNNYYVADFDGDGDLDILAAVNNGTGTYLRNDGATFSSQSTSTFPQPAANGRMLVGDFDGDGDADILYQTGTNGSAFQYARSNGDGTFTILPQSASPFAGLTLVDHTGTSYRVGDFDGDGDQDIISATNGSSGNLYLQSDRPPALISSTPGDNATGVSPGANIVLTFSEAVSKGVGNIYIVRTSDNQIVETISVNGGQITGSGTTWTIDPSITLVNGVAYAVRIDSRTFVDSAGIVYQGINGNTTLNFTVANQAPPVIANLNGDAVNYTEKSGGVLIDQSNNAAVTDADSANFNGGSVRVSVTGGAVTSEDVLSILSLGMAAGQISVSGSDVLYGGVLIGAFTGGSGGSALVITLNASADAAAVSALVQSLQYSNSNSNTISPNTGARTLSVTVTDGTGTSSASAAVTVNVLAVNDAPVVSTTGTNPTFTEDGSAVAVFSGTSINNVEAGQSIILMTVNVTNLVNGASEKLVIDGSEVTLTNGTNLITSNNGMNVSVSVSSGTATLTLAHAGLSTATAQTIVNNITYRNESNAPSGTSRTVTLTNVRDSGGTANGGLNTISPNLASIVTLVAVNDAPTLSGGPYAIPTTNEDTTSAALSVSTVLASTTSSDADAGAASGIAVTGTVGRGTWQYSTDGVTWTDFGTVSASKALLLTADTQVRYVPDGANGENVSFTFRAWDCTSGMASVNGSRSTGDTTTNGGSTAYSVGNAMATLIVSSVNDAPVMIPVNPTLTGLTDGSTSNSGDAVSTLLGGVADLDTGAPRGMAITGLTATYGKWQYSTNNGTTWNDVGAVSDSSALLLRPADRLRFVPDGIHGETATISYKAWDQTNSTLGLQGTKTNTSTSGSTTAYSTQTDTAAVVVTAINDLPVVTLTGTAASWNEGNNVTSNPVVVDPGVTLSDPDGPNPTSATVRLLTYYSAQDSLAFVNDGLSMGNIVGSWSAGTGILTLTSAGNTATTAEFQAAMRAVTYGNSSDSPNTTSRTIQFQVTDGGGLSSIAVTRDITISAVNDSPTITAPVTFPVSEDVVTPINVISFSDVDSNTGTVTLSVGSGTLSATSSSGVTVSGTPTALVLTGTLTDINTFISESRVTFTTAANATSNVTLTINVNTTSVSDATTTMTLQVQAVNDAPVATVPLSITVTEDVSSVITGISFTDIDAGINSVTATFSVPSGTLSATTGMGVTVGGSGTGELTLTGSLADINFFIAANGLTFKTAQDATASVILTVKINDKGFNGSGGEQTDTKTVTLNVTAVNDVPVNNLPAAQTASQNLDHAFNTANGNAISISDVDSGNGLMTVTLTATNGLLSLGSLSGINMVSNTGVAMTFEGNRTNINAALQTLTFRPSNNYLGAASITIETSDNGNSGTGGAKTDVDILSITVVPVNPKVTNVSAQGLDRTVMIGDEVLISMTWDQVVNVDLSSGSPTLLLETGLVDRNAVYVSGTGTNTLVFKYTVQAGDISADLDFQSTSALQMNGALITNNTSDLAVLTLPTVGGADSLGGRSNVVVDGVVPVVASVSVPFDGTYIVGQNLDFTVNFSENMLVDTTGGVPRIAVTLDTGGTVYAEYVSGSGGSALVFRLIVASGQLDSNGVILGSTVQLNGGSIRDTAGNDTVVTLNGVASTAHVNVDGVVPTVTSVTTPLDGNYKAGDVLTFTVNASEALQIGGLPPRLVLDVGGVTRYATYVSGSGSNALVFQYTVLAGHNDGNGIEVNGIDLRGEPLTDLAGNGLNLTLNGMGGTAGVVVDTTAPSAATIVRVDANPSNSGSVSFTVTFSEDVSGVDASDFNLFFGGSAAGSISSVTAVDGRTYTVVVGGLTGTGSLRLDLNNSGTGIVDGAGNVISGGLTGAAYSIDRVAPSVTSVDVPSHGTYLAGQNLDFTVHLDEVVHLDAAGGTPRIEVTLDNGATAYATYLSGAGSNALVFRLTVANGQLDTNGITLGSSLQLHGATLRDSIGNDANIALNSVGDTSQIRIDAVVPVVSSVSVPAGGSYKAGDVLTFTVNASEAVQIGSLAPRLALDVGGVTRYATYISGSGSDTLVFQYVVQPGDNDANGIAVSSLDLRGEQLTDLAGNDLNPALNGVGSTSGVLVDNVAPTASLSLDRTTLNAQETAQLTIRFSEAVTGLDVGDFTVTDGTLSDLVSTDGGITWTATLTPAAGKVQSHLQVVLNHTGYTDLAGNAAASDSLSDSYAIDTVLPAQPVLEVESNAAGNATVRVDALEAGAQWEYSLDAGQTWQTGQGNVVAIASPGQYLLQVRQTNAVGNRSEVAALTVDVAPLVVPPTVEWPVAGIFGNAGVWEIALPSAGAVPFGSVATEPVAPRTSGAFLGNDGASSGALATSPFFNADVATDRSELSLGFLGFAPSRSGEVPGASAPLGTDAGSGAGADRLVLLHPVDAVVADTGRQVDWKVPPTMFGHSDPLASVQFAMTQADGRPLPAWLKFDARTGQVSGTMPPGFQGELTLRLTARDSQGHAVSTTIKIKAGDAGPAARTGMAEQLQRHAQLRAGQMAAQRLHL